MKINLHNTTLLFCLLSIGSLFLKENLNSIMLIAFSLCSFVLLLTKKKRKGRYLLTLATPLLTYFILAGLGLIVNDKSNFSYFVRLLPFAIAPLYIFFFLHSNSARKYTVLFFILCNLVLLLVLDFMAIADMLENRSLYVTLNNRIYYRFLYIRYTNGYINHIYLSAYCLISTFLVLQYKPGKRKIVNNLILVFLIFHIAILGSRTVVIASILGAFVMLLLLSIKNKRNLKYLATGVVLLIMATTLVYAFRHTLLFNRYSQVFEWYEKKEEILQRNYSVNNRLKLYIVGTSMFTEPSMYGINGTGLSSEKIQMKYNTKFQDKFPLKTNTYNTHNQFINNFIDWGIIGLVVSLCLFYFPILNTLKNGLNWITLFWFCFLFILCMESVLIRHRGIVFFIIFYSLFSSKNNLAVSD